MFEPNPVAHQCEEKGCDSTDTILCEYSDEKGTQIYLCPKHAEETGFCIGCGYFYCGTSEWDHHPGWCDTCHDEARSSNDDIAPEDEIYYGPEDIF